MAANGKYLRVKNWSKFQHYKHRSPPWIKLHRGILDDYEFSRLQDASKAHLVLIWMLASNSDGLIPDNAEYLTGRLCLNEPLNLNELKDKGFLVDASEMLADCKQDARESKKERERKKDENPLDPCQHTDENGCICGKRGTHKLHPRSEKWYCPEHLDG